MRRKGAAVRSERVGTLARLGDLCARDMVACRVVSQVGSVA